VVKKLELGLSWAKEGSAIAIENIRRFRVVFISRALKDMVLVPVRLGMVRKNEAAEMSLPIS
jgi:hypothetical protein